MQFRPLGDNALTITPDAGVGPAALADALRGAAPAGVVDVIAAFDSVTILYDVTALQARTRPVDYLRDWAERNATSASAGSTRAAPRTIDVPVVYGGDGGPDLPSLAAATGLSVEAVVALHAGGTYDVAAVGFLPGFAYLTGLDARLRVPRRATPRVGVPAGSVAVGGPYTGVYPVASPGGWHLIGRTDFGRFDSKNPTATPFRVGDRVRFTKARR